MKKIVIVVIALAFAMPTFSQSNTKQSYNKNQFLLSLSDFSVSAFKVGYLRDFNSTAIELTAGFRYQDVNVFDRGEESLNLELWYRINILNWEGKKNRLRMYFAPYGQFKLYNYTEEVYMNSENVIMTDSGNSYGLGVLSGMSWTISKKIIINAYFGGGFRYAGEISNTGVGNIFAGTYRGILPKAGLEIGVAF